jgi:hypothetical protein
MYVEKHDLITMQKWNENNILKDTIFCLSLYNANQSTVKNDLKKGRGKQNRMWWKAYHN